MNWFDIIKVKQIGRKWQIWKDELAELGVTLIEECEGPNCLKTETVGRNTFQIVAMHDESGETVVFPWERTDVKGQRQGESLKKKARQAFRRAGIDIVNPGLKIMGRRRRG